MASGVNWQNRIISTALVRADAMLANEANWRLHPKAQQDALLTVVENVGLVAPVIVNKRNAAEWGQDRGIETMVDGHLRCQLALRQGDDTELPVVYVDLTPDEERLVLATFDPIAGLAAPDKEKLSELLESIDREDATIEALAQAVAGECKVSVDDAVPQSDETFPLARTATCPECGFAFDPTTS